jgi:hypothetical protein
MTDTSDAAAKRARRLLRCYPHVWRARYGDEFTQLLIDDMSERPRSMRRTADVIRTGLLARAASAGLAGDALEPQQQIRCGLAAVGCALIAFLAFGVAIWSQLTIGWQWVQILWRDAVGRQVRWESPWKSWRFRVFVAPAGCAPVVIGRGCRRLGRLLPALLGCRRGETRSGKTVRPGRSR